MKQHPAMRQAYILASEEIGEVELRGSAHNPKIVEWFSDVGHSWVQDDETAWCAAFTGAMLEKAGLPSTRKLNARSYLEWGEEVALADAQPGDIVVFWRVSPNDWRGHVGQFVRRSGKTIIVRGGNQSNKVSDAPYSVDRLLSVRRMPAPAQPAMPSQNVTSNPLVALLRYLARLFGGKNETRS